MTTDQLRELHAEGIHFSGDELLELKGQGVALKLSEIERESLADAMGELKQERPQQSMEVCHVR